ncbi:hypothetical protein IFM89_000868 [Coptis chinensis]|uniref:Translation initiation factor 5A C-terminal domain-containing protein n=1 Tax=Coptis chinensis TaxID=261450 RepID=A0A835M3F7_9MAGN|nr:hypothetical protein IFM89_000868 [Coptis chinensis]
MYILVLQVPHVNRTDCQLIGISEDGFVSPLTENGNTEDNLRLPTEEPLLTQVCGLLALVLGSSCDV